MLLADWKYATPMRKHLVDEIIDGVTAGTRVGRQGLRVS
jgi:hypothetical protein